MLEALKLKLSEVAALRTKLQALESELARMAKQRDEHRVRADEYEQRALRVLSKNLEKATI